MEWSDGKKRCCWANPKNERYIRYHDEEWGFPVHDDGKLFEMLVLECFQAGLSWECVLNKREAFRAAFDGFDLEAVCAYGEDKLEALRNDPGIIRNRLKIQAAVTNARAFREIQGEYGSFAGYAGAYDHLQFSVKDIFDHRLASGICDRQSGGDRAGQKSA